METKIKVNVEVEVPITHLPEAVESFVEKLAKDKVCDILNNANESISIEKINAISKGLIQG